MKLQRSAIAPDTMVAHVAANVHYNTKVIYYNGSLTDGTNIKQIVYKISKLYVLPEKTNVSMIQLAIR